MVYHFRNFLGNCVELQEVNFCNLLSLRQLQDEPNPTLEAEGEGEPLIDNLWHFHPHIWEKVKERFSTVDQLYAAILDIHTELRELKEKYRDQSADFLDLSLEYNLNGGVSSTYFLVDDEGTPQYVVKPLDEDGGAINSKSHVSPFHESPYRKNMPLYRICMREVAAYRIAQRIGIGSIVPKTEFSVLESASFHDFFEGISVQERKRYLDFCGSPDKEKLCSVQEFIPDSKSLFEALQELQMAKLSNEEIAGRFDQKDFEEVNILIWTTYDTDAHASNILVYSKGVDEIGNEVLGLKKIDNGLAFPDENQSLRNSLIHMKNADRELSSLSKAKILAIDADELIEELISVNLESAASALKERISILQNIVKRENITIKQINSELLKIGIKR